MYKLEKELRTGREKKKSGWKDEKSRKKKRQEEAETEANETEQRCPD